jgi:hypothetical protein
MRITDNIPDKTLSASVIAKYSKRSIPWLRKKAGEVFKDWIRERDKDQPCISCGSYSTKQAGHYYSAGHYPALEFDPDNVHGQCVRCNLYLSGNLTEYRKGLLKKIGSDGLKNIDIKAGYFKKHGYKHDRFNLIEIITRYK